MSAEMFNEMLVSLKNSFNPEMQKKFYAALLELEKKDKELAAKLEERYKRVVLDKMFRAEKVEKEMKPKRKTAEILVSKEMASRLKDLNLDLFKTATIKSKSKKPLKQKTQKLGLAKAKKPNAKSKSKNR